MTVDCNKYIINKAVIQRWYLETGKDDPKSAVSIMANATMVPCVVVAYWIAEVSDWSPFYMDKIQSFIKFYGYTEILNKPEGAPV